MESLIALGMEDNDEVALACLFFRGLSLLCLVEDLDLYLFLLVLECPFLLPSKSDDIISQTQCLNLDRKESKIIGLVLYLDKINTIYTQ